MSGATILFCVMEPGEFVELSRVAKLCQADGYHCLFAFLTPGYSKLAADSAVCIRESFDWVEPDGTPGDTSSGYVPSSLRGEMTKEMPQYPVPRQSRVKARLMRYTVGSGLFSLYVTGKILRNLGFRRIGETARDFGDVLRHMYYIHRRRFFYRSVLARWQPKLVVIGQEYVGSENTNLLHEAKKLGIPALMFPFALGTSREMVESMLTQPMAHVARRHSNRLLVKWYPKWLNSYHGIKLVRHPAPQALAYEWMGLSTTHPWIPNVTSARYIAVENETMLQYYKKMRFSADQLRLTGAAYDDMLNQHYLARDRLRQELCREYNLPEDRRFIVCAMPPNQFPARKKHCDFATYEEILDAWLGVIGQYSFFGYNVILKLHPVTKLPPHFNVQQYHVTLCDWDTAKLVALSDIFVASVSSTIRWAVRCGVPVVNYDVYRYGYQDFDAAPGVLTILEYKAFENALRRLASDQEYYQEVWEEQMRVAPSWGQQDGGSNARIMALIHEMTNAPEGSEIIPLPTTTPRAAAG